MRTGSAPAGHRSITDAPARRPVAASSAGPGGQRHVPEVIHGQHLDADQIAVHLAHRRR
ncbi:MAG: hypothetical protein WAN20_10765 [Pseudonocardiaceae bacterium]